MAMNTVQDVKTIVIVGGGTAGWMAALILADTLADTLASTDATRAIEITLLESPSVGTIGVGEGSTHAMKRFFDSLKISEAEWMPACHATYKCGITFDGWSTKPGYTSYFHQFSTMVDQLTQPVHEANVQARLRGVNAPASPNEHYLSYWLVKHKLAPVAPEHFPFTATHGYHFDAGLLGRFLHKKGVERGVRYRQCHVTHASLRESGDIAAVHTREGESITADLFVDCSGFSGLLIDQALKTPFHSYAALLPNNAAIAMPTPHEGDIAPHTVSSAMTHGWAWQIPLTSRYGNGYVYSSHYCTRDAAEFELRERLGLLDADVPARHLNMKVGRVVQHWNRNCVAVGLSQGFLEPLEATALYLTQMTVAIFALFLVKGDYSAQARTAYNDEINGFFDHHRDYVVAHYKLNSRLDTAYWRDTAGSFDGISDSLRAVFDVWLKSGNLGDEIRRQDIERYYPVGSWYALLGGMGIFPPLQAGADDGAYTRQRAEMHEFLRRCSLNFRSHRVVLAELAAGARA